MADTVRESIIQDVVTTLAGLTVANGYHYEMGASVVRAQKSWQDHELPAVSVWDISETVTERQFGTLDITLELQIDAAVAHVPDTLNASVAANRVLGDLIKVLTAGDTSRGDLAQATQYASSTIEYPEAGASGVIVSAVFNVVYTAVKGDPYTSA